MPITECGYGHLYDNEQYATCPYCNKSAGSQVGGGIMNTPFANPGRPIGTAGVTEPVGGMGSNMNINPPIIFDQRGEWENHRSVTNDSVTVEPESHRRSVEESQKTIGKYEEEMGIEPVAGWLVCIKGEDIGKSFPLLARINFIGRSESMDVCLKKDMTISKQNHAQISYEPRHRKFYLIRGESKNNIYLNDAPVYMPTELNGYDLVGMGDTDLVFIPFCGARFSWEDGLIKE